VNATAPTAAATLLDTLLPTYDVRTMHGRGVDATVERVAGAIRTTAVDDAHVARVLMGVRTLGRSLRHRSGPIAEIGDGEAGFLRIDSSVTEIVVGFAGRPWPGGARLAPFASPEEWRAFAPTDAVKVALSIRCGPADYGTLLVTETRIQCGELARRPFGRYWRLVRPGSDLVRGSLLRAIARAAQAPA
jgi:hypothetical protein